MAHSIVRFTALARLRQSLAEKSTGVLKGNLGWRDKSRASFWPSCGWLGWTFPYGFDWAMPYGMAPMHGIPGRQCTAELS